MTTDSDQVSVKNLGGRKEKWSPALANKVIEFITEGLNFQQAAQAVGVCPNTLRVWRRDKKGFNERVEAAREVLRASVLAKIKEAGAKDWRAHAEFLRLCFAEYRYGNGPTVNVAVQNNMEVTDPERASLIERRERALAKSAVETPQLSDASDARATAEEAEAQLAHASGVPPADPEPKALREHAPRNIVERSDDAEAWRAAAREAAGRDEVEQILDF